MGGGAGTFCSTISLETEFASSELQMARLSSGRQEGVGWGMCSQQLHLSAPCSLPMDDNGAMMQTSGYDSMGGSQCRVGPGSSWKLAWQLLILLWAILKLESVIVRCDKIMIMKIMNKS